MQVKIYTFSDKRPDFIRWQRKTFDHFLKDEYEFIVVNNASSYRNKRKIEKICKEQGAVHIELIEKHHENPNVACAYPIDFMIREFISADRTDIASVIIDSDMFLVREFSVTAFLSDHWIAALPQRRGHVKYIWNGLVFINHRTIQDIDELSFCCSGCKGFCPFFDDGLWQNDSIEGQRVDVGGGMYFYFKRHPDCKLKKMTSTHHITPERNNLHTLPAQILDLYDPSFCFELLNQTFFHYGSGSDWKRQGRRFHKRKTKLADRLVCGALDGSIEIPLEHIEEEYVDPEFRSSQ